MRVVTEEILEQLGACEERGEVLRLMGGDFEATAENFEKLLGRPAGYAWSEWLRGKLPEEARIHWNYGWHALERAAYLRYERELRRDHSQFMAEFLDANWDTILERWSAGGRGRTERAQALSGLVAGFASPVEVGETRPSPEELDRAARYLTDPPFSRDALIVAERLTGTPAADAAMAALRAPGYAPQMARAQEQMRADVERARLSPLARSVDQAIEGLNEEETRTIGRRLRDRLRRLNTRPEVAQEPEPQPSPPAQDPTDHRSIVTVINDRLASAVITELEAEAISRFAHSRVR